MCCLLCCCWLCALPARPPRSVALPFTGPMSQGQITKWAEFGSIRSQAEHPITHLLRKAWLLVTVLLPCPLAPVVTRQMAWRSASALLAQMRLSAADTTSGFKRAARVILVIYRLPVWVAAEEEQGEHVAYPATDSQKLDTSGRGFWLPAVRKQPVFWVLCVICIHIYRGLCHGHKCRLQNVKQHSKDVLARKLDITYWSQDAPLNP